MARLIETRSNGCVSFSERVELSYDINSAIENADIVVISISAQNLRKFVSELPNASKVFRFSESKP